MNEEKNWNLRKLLDLDLTSGELCEYETDMRLLRTPAMSDTAIYGLTGNMYVHRYGEEDIPITLTLMMWNPKTGETTEILPLAEYWDCQQCAQEKYFSVLDDSHGSAHAYNRELQLDQVIYVDETSVYLNKLGREIWKIDLLTKESIRIWGLPFREFRVVHAPTAIYQDKMYFMVDAEGVEQRCYLYCLDLQTDVCTLFLGEPITSFTVTPQGIFYRVYEKFRSDLIRSDGIPAVRVEKDLYACYLDGSGARSLYTHPDIEFTELCTVRGSILYGFVDLYTTGDKAHRVFVKLDLSRGTIQEINVP